MNRIIIKIPRMTIVRSGRVMKWKIYEVAPEGDSRDGVTIFGYF
jgi:hypothetical protein